MTADPKRIGTYRILRILGEGGMGKVYEAEQAEPVRRRVAIKVVSHGIATGEVIARFEAERQALALMDHSSIAKVFDGGETDEGLPYFVMELVKGIPITDYCDTHRLETPERLKLYVSVCAAVQHAHQKGIIHRDLKPSNILVTVEDGEPVPKIIDFGIAKAIRGGLTDRTVVTDFGLPIGTWNYMSPEQAEMSELDVDTRTDIYSLGAMLYELLVGAHPLDLRSLPIPAVIVAIRERDPPTPSTRFQTLPGDQQATLAAHRHADPPSLRRTLRGDLDWIVMKCLEKDRTRRYQSASELGSDLGRYLADEPVSARPPGAVYRAVKFVRRHRAGVTAAALVLIALIGGAAAATVGMVRAQRAESRARQMAQAVLDDLDWASAGDRVRERVLEAQVAIIGDRPDLSARFKTALDEAFADERGRHAYERMAEVYLRLGYLDEAAARLRSAVEAAENADVETRIDLLRQLGRIQIRQERYGEADATLSLAVTLWGSLETESGPSSRPPNLLRQLATAREGVGKTEEAEALREEAASIERRILENARTNR